MGKYKITLISDTHTKHTQLKGFLEGGDILIHAGDFMGSGYDDKEADSFIKWFDEIDNYETKIFISGNHDRIMENAPDKMKEMISTYKTINYLEDEDLVLYYDGPNGYYVEENVHIYGSPWQPEFFNWAFNLPRGEKLKEKWDLIPRNTDILITHSPPFGKLDYVPYSRENVGCEELIKRVEEIKPKIHVFGHIHEGYGYVFDGNTHYFNASVLNGRYELTNKPFTFIWDSISNKINFEI